LSDTDKLSRRQELWKQKYLDKPAATGVPFGGISNARPETKVLAAPQVDLTKLPFDPLEYIDFKLPWDGLNPG
jgi:hypothetical protein